MSMTPVFWKLSQGGDDFIEQQVLMSIEQRLVYVHGDTRAIGGTRIPQGAEFINAPIGDYFYLTYKNKGVYLIGQFTGPPNCLSDRGGGWVDRPFRLIRAALEVKPYSGPQRRWAPNYNSTFIRVPPRDLAVFEASILIPHFGIRLAEFRRSKE